MNFLWIAAFFLLFSVVRSANAPGQVYDLKNFKLQLPTCTKPTCSSIDEIQTAALKTYQSQYFKLDEATNEMVFWCPVNGLHTSGSKYPRTELRENQNLPWNNNGGGDWTFIGYHRMDVTMKVLTQPPSGTIAIGQVHGSKIGKTSISGGCSIIIEFEWKNGKLVNYLRGVQKGKNNCQTISQTLPGTYTLGEQFSFSLIVNGNTVSVQTSKGGTSAPHSYSWFKTSGPSTYWMYFKVGDYVQDVGKSSTLGGRVSISSLKTFHSQTAPTKAHADISEGLNEATLLTNDGIFTIVGILAAIAAVLTIVMVVLVIIYIRREDTAMELL